MYSGTFPNTSNSNNIHLTTVRSSNKDTVVNIDHLGSNYVSDKQSFHVQESEVRPSESQTRLTRSAVRRETRELPVERGGQLTAFGQKLANIFENTLLKYFIYILPVSVILAIPTALFATSHREVTADGVHLLGLFIWIQIVWAFLWVAKLLAFIMPIMFQGLCGLVSTGVRKYALVLKAVETPLSLFLWTILCLVWFPLIYVYDRDYVIGRTGGVPWLNVLKNVIRASILNAAIFLIQKMFMQLISVSYHSRQFNGKIQDIKLATHAVDLLYAASLAKFYDHHPDFADDDYDIHDTTNMQRFLRKSAADRRTKQIFGEIHFFGERFVSAVGQMASEVAGTEVLNPTATHAIVEAALARTAGAEALARRIFKSLVQPGATSITEQDILDELGPGKQREASFIFDQLDRDRNGDVSLDEMSMLVVGLSRGRKDMMKSAVNIKDAIKVLDSVIGILVLIIVILIYSAFFSSTLADNLKNLVTILSASAFAFGQTVGEFNACCIHVFVKHPFDVGDRVNIGDVQYEVITISLLYTVFRRIDTDAIVQIANAKMSDSYIDNVSRSKAMKESITFSVYPTTSFDQLEQLRTELEAFVSAPENSRDYQTDIDVQLLSVGNMKQLDLKVELYHKSNWSNDRLRAYRRSKFMCALLSAMRKVPIQGPEVELPDFEEKAKLVEDYRTRERERLGDRLHNDLEILPSHRAYGAKRVGKEDEGFLFKRVSVSKRGKDN